MNEPILDLQNVCKRYGKLEVVKGLSLQMKQGECLGLLGPNGAGKTSTLKMITGQASISAGTVKLFGIDFQSRSREIRSRIGVVTQDDTLDEEVTAFENLTIFASYFRIPLSEARTRAEELLDFVQLTEKRNSRIPDLSGGMRRRLLIARALVNAPDFLILDEPTTGLDPQARHLIWQRLRLLKRQGVTMLLTTHYMEEAEQLCDRLLLMEEGSVIAEGAPDALIAKHVGQDVLEVRTPEIPPEQLRERLELQGFDTETSADTLYIFLHEGDQLPAKLKQIEGIAVHHRPATLEDVFLRLTGRGLIN